MHYDISVIVPTYNVEDLIEDCINSVLNQTFSGTIELILIDDCSTDNTVSKLNEMMKANPNFPMKILVQEKNMRQGTARNRGVKEAKGKYIMFLDGDDFLDPEAFRVLFEKAERESCDFVLCDWVYFYEDRGLVYVNNDEFLFYDNLMGNEIESLYKAETYFSVNKLYKKSFLMEHNIEYGEGYIYEDFEFYIQVAQYANKVGVVQNPLYRVRVNENSTTKTNRKSSIHVESLVKAIENTVQKFHPRLEESYYHVYKYLVRKTLQYLDERAPRKYKRTTLTQVLQILNQNKNYPVPKKVVPLYHFLFRRKYIQNGQINKILLVWKLYKKGKLNRLLALAQKLKWGILNTKLGKKYRKRKWDKKLQSFRERPIEKNTVLFLGFDYRYIGNSRYFFDYLRDKDELNIYFVTKDISVPKKNRITPRSLKFYETLSTANVVIFESWLPLDFYKREEATWIQLWHGTPIKKLFFDSHEYYISKYNKNHKRNKQRDIQRWDYLLADSEGGLEKLASAFAYDYKKILYYGYPRVQFLKDNKTNLKMKNEIKNNLKIDTNKKVILYVPTWRDYNYKSKNPRFSYLLDAGYLSKELNEDYVILFKEHSMSNYQMNNPNIIIPDNEIEIQQLLLITDVVISDFSSVIFDAIAVDIPFYLFINDYEEYDKARGIYSDLSELLRPYFVDKESELASKILTIQNTYPLDRYNLLKEQYTNQNDQNSYYLLESKIKEIMDES